MTLPTREPLSRRMCGVTWSHAGIPSFPSQYGFGYACVALGDMLIASGDRERGIRLLRASVADMDYIAHVRKRGDVWYVIDRATALALLGDRKAALAALDKAVHTGYINTWELLPLEPAFDFLARRSRIPAIDERREGEDGL